MPLLAKPSDSTYQITDHVIKLAPAFIKNNQFRFKKVTATRFASILGLSKYCSPFKTWLIMVNLFKDEMDETLAQVGNIIEPKIRDYVSKALGIEFIAHDPRTVKFDCFKDNPIFGGIPDGEPLVNQQINYQTGLPMLEIKTSSVDKLKYATDQTGTLRMQKDANGLPIVVKKNGKYDEWINDGVFTIPLEYQYQLGLYLYLRKANAGVFAIGFLQPQNYFDPKTFNEHDNQIKIIKMTISSNLALDNKIDYATKWYNDYIKTGTSPAMNEADETWFNRELKAVN